MPFNLRVPQALDVKIRARSAELGISINAFVLIVLDAHFNPPSPAPVSAVEPSPSAVTLGETSPVNTNVTPERPLTKAERVALHNANYVKAKAKQHRLDLRSSA